jgi:hypothetical protein
MLGVGAPIVRLRSMKSHKRTPNRASGRRSTCNRLFFNEIEECAMAAKLPSLI